MSNDYIIATVSTADLTKEYAEEHNLPFISYTYEMDGKVYIDDWSEEGRQELFRQMRAGIMPNTAAITEYQYEEFFRKLLSTGKDVIFTDMSRAISSSVSNAETAIGIVTKEFPNQRFYFVDSFCITGGLALLVSNMVELKEEGKSFDEVVDYAEKVKDRMIHWFTCNDLMWLKKGGRCSSASAIVGTMLSIKPILQVLSDGSLQICYKVRGRKNVMRQMVEKTAIDWDDEFSNDKVIIDSADADEDAEKLKQLLLEMHPNIKKIEIIHEGPVIGTHVGPDFLAIHYIGKERKNIKYY